MDIAYIRTTSMTSTGYFECCKALRDSEEQYLQIWKFCKNDILAQVDEQSGEDGFEKPELMKTIKNLEAGDKIYVYDFSRIAYSIESLLSILEKLHRRGAFLYSVKEQFDSSTKEGKKFIEIMKQLYAFEKNAFRERQRIGICKAKKKDQYKGRRKLEKLEVRDYRRLQRKEITKVALAKELHISRPTLDRMIEEYNTIVITLPNINLGLQDEIDFDEE